MTLRIIAGRFRNRILQSPKGLEVRPSTGQLREALFNICQMQMEGATFLDLFAGSGAMGLEALSRGASHSTFIESSRHAAQAIRDNCATLGVDRESNLLIGDVFALVNRLGQGGKQFRIIFADPPYSKESKGVPFSHKLLQMVDELHLLLPGGLLFIEDAADAAPPQDGKISLHFQDQRRYGRSSLQQWIAPQ